MVISAQDRCVHASIQTFTSVATASLFLGVQGFLRTNDCGKAIQIFTDPSSLAAIATTSLYAPIRECVDVVLTRMYSDKFAEKNKYLTMVTAACLTAAIGLSTLQALKSLSVIESMPRAIRLFAKAAALQFGIEVTRLALQAWNNRKSKSDDIGRSDMMGIDKEPKLLERGLSTDSTHSSSSNTKEDGVNV